MAERGVLHGSSASAAALIALIEKAFDYPRAGRQVGAGIHAPSAQGRTLRHMAAPRKHPTLSQWVVLANRRVERALADERAEVRSRLTPGEETQFSDAIAAISDIGDEWFPSAPV